MKIAVFSAKQYDKDSFNQANSGFGHELVFFESRLKEQTVQLAEGFEAVCVFTNDVVNKTVIEKLHQNGIRLIALRCAGYNNVDLEACAQRQIPVVRVPAYSPHAVAEHALALVMALNRKTHRAYNRVREGNFSLEGLMGYDLYGKMVGIVGTGRIGLCAAQIFKGLGCRVIAYDHHVQEEGLAMGVEYIDFDTLLQQSDIVTLHCPLTEDNHHLFNEAVISQMKDGAMLINTGRGGLIDTRAVIDALKSEKIGALGLDVYEDEKDLFFKDRSDSIIKDDVFSRLLTFPNVLITGHQAFFTEEAMSNIALTTLENISAIEKGHSCANQVKPAN
jgi:D-lactate dehydrogenase